MSSLLTMSVRRKASDWCRFGLAIALTCLMNDAAQARVGGIGIGGGIGPPTLPSIRGIEPPATLRRQSPVESEMKPPAVDTLSPGAQLPSLTKAGALLGLRERVAKTLLREYAALVEPDPHGEPMLRAQIVAWSPSPAALVDALRHGYVVLRSKPLPSLDATLVVLGVPQQMGTAEALAQLRAADPQGEYDFNHLYEGSGQIEPAPRRLAATSLPSPGVASITAQGTRMGLIDSGIALGHPAFQRAAIRQWGCDDKSVASAHGTAVASLLLGHDRGFHGVASSASLYAADVYCGVPTGGATEQIVEALGWMAKEGVGVINVSLVGPPNRTLERAVSMMLQRGHILIAAVGNDGPNAPPLYPASYAGVVGVTAIDPARKALPEAARGSQVMLAAPGSDMLAASAPTGYGVVRGTSFAAPIVAAMLAEKLSRPDPARAQAAVRDLLQQAERLTVGRADDIGWGIVGERFRTAPTRLADPHRGMVVD